MAPAPNRYHQTISKNLEFILHAYLKEHPLGWVYDAPFDVQVTQTNVYQPDIVYVARERKSILTDQGVQGAPNLVVEILSPSTREFDQGPKLDVYSRVGVEAYWLIDPELKTVTVFDFSQDAMHPQATFMQRSVIETPLFADLKISCSDIFAEDK